MPAFLLRQLGEGGARGALGVGVVEQQLGQDDGVVGVLGHGRNVPNRRCGGKDPPLRRRVRPRACAYGAAMSDGSTELRPFRIEVPQADLDDLAARLGAARWPAAAPW